MSAEGKSSGWTVRKLIEFEASHQLAIADSAACHETIHGHSYLAEVVLQSRVPHGQTLGPTGMVLDFGSPVFKEIKREIMNTFDHALIMPCPEFVGAVRPVYHPASPEEITEARKSIAREWAEYIKALKKHNRKIHVWPCNPTAEMMAQYIYDLAREALRRVEAEGVDVKEVSVHETRTGKATYFED